jgi:VIT1/CCC1 family predicted Fe2+/Mn2+ transporter
LGVKFCHVFPSNFNGFLKKNNEINTNIKVYCTPVKVNSIVMSEKSAEIDEYLDNHYIHKSNWLRAAVLGANDGILSTASIAIGVSAASDFREPVILATLAGLVAGALSMAAGEYVSVSSQTDVEKADIEREKIELAEMPEIELQRLADIYEQRGLKKKRLCWLPKS